MPVHYAQPAWVSPLRPVLEGIAQMIDAELAAQASDRAAALAGIAAALMGSQAPHASPADLPWFIQLGETFHRWRCFAAGAEYWRGLYQLATAAGRAQADEGTRIMASAGAFQVLAGEITAGSPSAASVAAHVAQVFGPGHVLCQEVQARLGVRMSQVQQAVVPAAQTVLAGLDPVTKNALWVTLAFMEMAMADGKVHDEEWTTWQRIMTQLRLPNVWEMFGGEALQQMLRQGALSQLSMELSGIPMDKRAELAGLLMEFMTADGRIDAQETAAMERITGWLGVTVKMPGRTT